MKVYEQMADIDKMLNENDQKRKANDEKRQNEELKRVANETVRFENEEDRKTAEEERVKAEAERVDAEAKRVFAEEGREEKETNRIEEEKRFNFEKKRNISEKERIEEEKIRIASEKIRIENEKQRINWYNKVFQLEKLKVKSENERVEAEKGRAERDKVYQEKELQRQKNEQSRILAEEKRVWVQEQNLKLLEEKRSELEKIPLKNFSKPEEEEEKEIFETFFTDLENTTDWIEDQKMRDRVKNVLDNLDKEEETPPETYKNALLDVISEFDDRIIDEHWDTLILQEKEKFEWTQRTDILKQVFLEKDIVLTIDDLNVYQFFKDNLTDTFSPKRNELNGFKFKDKKIIKRNKDRTFSFVDSPALKEFLSEFKLVNQSANSLITDNLEFFSDKETNKKFAEEYIERLREEQIDSIRKSEEGGEYFEMKEFNEMNEEILQIRQNKRFKIRPKVWKKSLGGLCQRAARGLKLIFKRHWYKIASGIFAVVSAIFSFFALKKVLEKMGEAGKTIQKQIEDVHDYLSEKLKSIQGSSYFVPFLGFISAILSWLFTKPFELLQKGFRKIIGLILKILIPFVSFFLGVGHILSGDIRYVGLKLYEWSFLLWGEDSPDETTEEIVEILGEKNITNYKEQNLGPKNQFKPTLLTKTIGVVLGVAGKTIEKTGDVSEFILDFITNYLKYIFYIIFAYLILDTLNKWRN